jgi:hypothetical protein
VVVEVKGNMFGIKGPNKREKLKQLASCHMKLLKYGSIGDGVENIYNIHMYHHLVGMDV